MASFSAYLIIGKFETWLNTFVLDVHQQIDELGRPASLTHGGRMTLSFDATGDSMITGWTISPNKQYSGTVTFYDLNGQVLKEVSFQNAFCIDQHESFAGTGQEGQAETTLIISPEKIVVGNVEHDNDWPATETT